MKSTARDRKQKVEQHEKARARRPDDGEKQSVKVVSGNPIPHTVLDTTPKPAANVLATGTRHMKARLLQKGRRKIMQFLAYPTRTIVVDPHFMNQFRSLTFREVQPGETFRESAQLAMQNSILTTVGNQGFDVGKATIMLWRAGRVSRSLYTPTSQPLWTMVIPKK